MLKPTGVFFLNIGDSYAGHNAPGYRPGNEAKNGGNSNKNGIGYVIGLKPKDLCLVPERLAIALQIDGWWIRSRIVWHKLNPMPESVTDRPTSAHDTIWMLTKRPNYFWDAQVVKEDAEMVPQRRGIIGGKGNPSRILGDNGSPSCRNFRDYQTQDGDGFRNLRNVWSFASHPFPQAHFATFPPELAERCIKAGSSEKGCCAACGAPWVRVVEKSGGTTGRGWHDHNKDLAVGQRKSESGMDSYRVKSVGWQPSCKCPPSDLVPARILDPFAGAGTTGLVADRIGRDCTLIDLNTAYINMSIDRIRDDAPLFTEVAAE